MLRLKKKTEYALIALQALGELPDDALVSSRELAGRFGIPDMLLAKVLQTLKRHGLATSVQGAAGGYRLARPLRQIQLIDVFEIFGETMDLVSCSSGSPVCDPLIRCDIQGPMLALSDALQEFLQGLSLDDLFRRGAPAPSRPLEVYLRAGSGD